MRHADLLFGDRRRAEGPFPSSRHDSSARAVRADQTVLGSLGSRMGWRSCCNSKDGYAARLLAFGLVAINACVLDRVKKLRRRRWAARDPFMAAIGISLFIAAGF